MTTSFRFLLDWIDSPVQGIFSPAAFDMAFVPGFCWNEGPDVF